MNAQGKQLRLGPMEAQVQRLPEGVIYLRSPRPLPSYPNSLTDRLLLWAERRPDQPFLAERTAEGGWRTVTYSQALTAVRSLGQALLDRGVSVEQPLAILSGNDIEHALLGLAALYIGVPYVPVSSAYSLLSIDFGKLQHVLDLTTPKLLYVADGELYKPAISRVAPQIDVVAGSRVDSPRQQHFEELLATRPTDAVERARRQVNGNTLAKILFTSGSTGQPKGVPNTQRMLCSNQATIQAFWQFLEEQPPVLLDWLPWSHTFGGNQNFNLVLYNGGTLYIDDGRPTPSETGLTVRNLREISPTLYFNVPKGYEMLLPHLRADAELRKSFFARLQMLFYAGAALPEHLWEQLRELADREGAGHVPLLTGFGATETAPAVLFTTPSCAKPGAVGVPSPGVEVKLVPFDGRYEVRVRGPNVTPGYWRAPEHTAEVFDEEGYYRMGDAVKLLDAERPELGLQFDGRVAENFKLSSGTWVNVGELRARLIAEFAPCARDIVLVGENRDFLAGILIPDVAACQAVATDVGGAGGAADLAGSRVLRHWLAQRLARHVSTASGSSTCVRRLLVLPDELSFDAGEVTEKGSVNQRAVRARRTALIDALYQQSPGADVILPLDS